MSERIADEREGRSGQARRLAALGILTGCVLLAGCSQSDKDGNPTGASSESSSAAPAAGASTPDGTGQGGASGTTAQPSAAATATGAGTTAAANAGSSDSSAATIDPAKLKYPVPDGSAEQLLEYIAELSQQRPQGDTPDAIGADLAELLKSRVYAAEKILRSGPIPDIQYTALETKMEALRVLSVVDPEGAGKQFRPFVDQLLTDKDTRKQLLARVAMVQLQVEMIRNGQLTNPDEVMKEVRDLVSGHSNDPVVFAASKYVGWSFEQMGYDDLTQEIYTRAGEAFQDATDARTAEEAKALLDQAKFLGLKSLATTAKKGDAQALTNLVQAVEKMINESQDVGNTLGICVQTAQMFELDGQWEPARQFYQLALAKFGQHSDKLLAESVRTSVELFERRAGLAGKQFTLAGVTHDGKPFDWKAYSGKWVLIDFWTSYADPASIAEITSVYDKYHPLGLEVVGVNLDEKKEDRDQFLKSNPLPWVTVINPDPDKQGLKDPNAFNYGVESVPFRVLVAPTGEIRDWNLLSDRLTQKLDEVLKK